MITSASEISDLIDRIEDITIASCSTTAAGVVAKGDTKPGI